MQDSCDVRRRSVGRGVLLVDYDREYRCLYLYRRV